MDNFNWILDQINAAFVCRIGFFSKHYKNPKLLNSHVYCIIFWALIWTLSACRWSKMRSFSVFAAKTQPYLLNSNIVQTMKYIFGEMWHLWSFNIQFKKQFKHFLYLQYPKVKIFSFFHRGFSYIIEKHCLVNTCEYFCCLN